MEADQAATSRETRRMRWILRDASYGPGMGVPSTRDVLSWIESQSPGMSDKDNLTVGTDKMDGEN